MNQTGGFRSTVSKSENKYKSTGESMNSIAKKYMEQLERAHTKRTESTDTRFSEMVGK